MEFLEAHNISKIYQLDANTTIHAVKEISLKVKTGEFVCIMGPSGSGKSTLLNLLTTIDIPTIGKVCINGININVLSSDKLSTFRNQHLGFIFQNYNLMDEFTIYENLVIPLGMVGLNQRTIKNKIIDITTKLGINEILDKETHECSGGQLQRVAIARALINNPTLIVADEPTGNLDSYTTEGILSIFEQFYQEGKTIIMVSHDCFVASHASRVLYLEDGVITNEILRKNKSKEEMFDEIVEVSSMSYKKNS